MTSRWLLAALMLAPAALAAPLPFAVPEDAPLPDRPEVRAPRVAFDCASAPTLTVTPALSEILAGDTTGAAAQVDGYDCVGWQETGPEAVWRLDVREDTSLHAVLESDADLDLFLLTDCDSDSCAAWHVSEFLVTLPARAEPYVLVADGYLGAEGAFTLTLTGYGAGPAAAVCTEAETVPCDVAPAVRDGNLFERPNDLLGAACAAYLQFGGEQWYAVSLSDSATLSATLDAPFFDGSLWLFDDCGPGAACVAFEDAGSAGVSETLTFRNLTGARRTYYLAADAFRPVASDLAGAYTLSVSCEGQIVPNERKSLGGMKAMFR